MAMQLTIPEDLQALIEQRIANGEFQNAEEVVRHALEAQVFDEDWTDEEKQAISDRLEESYQQAERGELIDGDEVRRRMAVFKQQWIKAHQPT